MHRQRPSSGSGFDGPGARTILGEPGPSSAAAQSSQSPGMSDPPSPAGRHGRGGHLAHDSRGGHYPPPHGGYSHRPPSSHHSHPYASADRAGPPPLASAPIAPPVIKRVGGKANVSSACGPCKRAHLACDVARPCKRCVNMGKEDQCEDVPHKKRGRPKVNKPPTSEPYPTRPSRPSDDGSKWKPAPPPYEAGYGQMTSSPQQIPLGALTSRLPSPPRSASLGSVVGMTSLDTTASYTMPTPMAASSLPPPPTPDLFTLFCTTDLKILRVTSASHPLTGYHPHEFVNLNLLDWIHQNDRQLIDMERSRLVAVPYLSGQLQSSRETHAAVMTCTEHELLSPASGMREPYPNQNVRILRSDNSWALFNVRIHLGGGLGGSLWEPNTLGKIYLVVSCLLISNHDVPADVVARRPPLPPTPVTPLAPPPAHALPSFSSIAAAADAPSRPDSGYRPGSATHYRQPGPSSSYPGSRRSTTPPHSQGAYPRSYASYPPPPSSPYYPAQHGQYDPRREADWRRQAPPPPPPGQAQQDYTRRAWEL